MLDNTQPYERLDMFWIPSQRKHVVQGPTLCVFIVQVVSQQGYVWQSLEYPSCQSYQRTFSQHINNATEHTSQPLNGIYNTLTCGQPTF